MANRPIDEKLVVMKLDNSDFARKAVETTSLFGKLRDTLNKVPGVNLGKTSQELGNISKAANNMGMDRLASTVQNVANRFSTLGIMGVTALTNITNRAVDMGINLAKSLSVDQIMGGFQEYELKMGTIQTILANTQRHGTTLEDVSKSLNDLNEYADKTIYNFGDMTRNIGLFTNAGLKLEESTSMIKGFSNAAAASGTNATDAARAAYQLSQGLSQGYIMTMDWMSLTNAGMGNDNMKRDLIAIGQAMGTLKKSTESTMTNWKDVLSKDKWLTSDVMSTYLQAMAGDLDKATLMTKGLTSAQADMLLQNAKTGEEAATYVRTFTQLMDTLQEAVGSGWAETFEHIFGDFNEATKLWTKVSDAIGGIIDESSKARNQMMSDIADKGGFQNIFDGIQNASKPLVQIFQALGEGFRKVFPPVTVDQVMKLTENFKKFTSGLAMSEKQVSSLTTIFQGAFSVFDTVFEIAKKLGGAILQLIPEGAGRSIFNFLEGLAEMVISFNQSVKEGNGLTRFIDGLGNVLSKVGGYIKEAISSVIDFSSSLRENLGKAVDWVTDKLKPFGQFLAETFSGFGGDDLLGAGALAGGFIIVKKIMDFFDGLKGKGGGLGDLIENITETFEGIGEAVNGFVTSVKYVNLILIATAIAILAVSLKTLEGIKTEDLVKGMTALASSLGIMLAGMTVISAFKITGGLGASVTLIALATAVSIMAGALNKISDLKPRELATGIGGLVAITGALALAVVAISKLGGKMGTSSLQLVALAGAVYILAEAVKTMSAIDSGDLFKSIGALALIFGQIALFLNLVNKTKFGPGSALGMVAIAGALHIMVSAIQKINEIDTDELIKGLVTIGVILAQIAIFSAVSSGPTLVLAGAGLLLIAGAINALMGPISELGAMSWEELIKGLGGMAVALAAIAGAAMLMQGGLAGAAGLVIMAGALSLIISPIERLAAMTWAELVKGFVGMAGAIGLLAGAAILLTPVIPSMLGFGTALALMGAAMLAVGAGIALFGVGLTTLATMTATSIAAIVSAIALLLKGFAELIPAAVDFVVKLGLALIDGIGRLVPPLADTVVTLIIKLLEVIDKHLPRFLELGVGIVVKLMEGIGEYVPVLVDEGLKMIISLIQGMSDAVRDNGPLLISSVLELLGEIILLVVEAGVQTINALFGWIPGVEDVTAEIGATAEKYIRDNFGAKEVAEQKGSEFATSLASQEGPVRNAGETLANAAKTGVTSIDLTTAGTTMGTQFASGIGSRTSINSVQKASQGLADTSYFNIKSQLNIQSPSKDTDKLGQNTGEGFARGISKKKKSAAKAAKEAATAAKNAFKEAMDNADYRFEMEFINSKQYIAELERIKKAYAKTPAMVREVDLKVKKLKDDAAKEDRERRREEARQKKEQLKELFEAEKKYISDRKYYNDLSTTQELKAYEALQKKYKQGSNERKEIDKEVYRLKNEINRKMIDENDNYIAKVKQAQQEFIDGERALNEEYEDLVKNRTRSLTDFVSLFDKVSTPENPIVGRDLIDNLRGQVETLAQWTNNITSLANNMNMDKGLLQELREMGPSAAAEIAALNTLTDTQLIEYVNLWKTKHEFARKAAIAELEENKKETAEKIEELKKQTEKQLGEYKDEWLKKISEIKDGTKDQFVGLNTDMNTIGKNIIQGLMNGMGTMKGPLEKEVKSLANSISSTIRDTLGIKSPSVVLTKDGEFAGEGVVVGISNKISSVASSAKDLAKTAVDTINGILDQFDPTLRDDELHFKAVVDYDGIDPNKFGKNRPRTFIPDLSFANESLGHTRANTVQNGNKTNSKSDFERSYDGRPILIQSILNGRVIAEETYSDMGQLLGSSTGMAMSMRGG